MTEHPEGVGLYRVEGNPPLSALLVLAELHHDGHLTLTADAPPVARRFAETALQQAAESLPRFRNARQ
ncbi:hypothetical protein [uncultured Thiodictyon sp.]|uniref:hypothetical protein n=1 Tax=uncultured Thiodictyon sp. TaxID=1846217 RepID=UPI0025F7C709|nr:hypothetical protein [uncultured Thiodictyon sp.]